jgi:phosphoribosylaminoimidazole-succinocarboxamide synthase
MNQDSYERVECRYQGSVKNVLQHPQSCKSNMYFEFTDDYSLFDWGKMPQTIEHKGLSLSLMGKILFQMLGDGEYWKYFLGIENRLFNQHSLYMEKERTDFLFVGQELADKGLSHHLLSTEETEEKEKPDLPMHWMKVKPVHVERPQWNKDRQSFDYQFYQQKKMDKDEVHSPSLYLVPLEVIYRFGIPEGSSLKNRLNEPRFKPSWDKKAWSKVIATPENMWQRPFLEFTTKLEPQDRFLTPEEAQELAGMTDQEWIRFCFLSEWVALFLHHLFKDMGLQLWDGKIEWAFQGLGQRDFMLVDSLGPDEMRLMYGDHHLSKEMLRQFYKTTRWAQQVQASKQESLKKNHENWKEHHQIEAPPILPQYLSDRCSLVYRKLVDDLYHYQGRSTYFGQEHVSWDSIFGPQGGYQ